MQKGIQKGITPHRMLSLRRTAWSSVKANTGQSGLREQDRSRASGSHIDVTVQRQHSGYFYVLQATHNRHQSLGSQVTTHTVR